MPKYKVIDLFAGAGGLSNGFEQTGRFEVVGAVEINREALETYIYNQIPNKENTDLIIRDEETNISDITKLDFRDYIVKKCISREDVIVIGGPPCQGFSNSNRQKNYLISNNNQLVKQFARVIDEVRPRAFLMENVKTMNSTTHKFFVTNGKKEKYSSMEHLREVFGEELRKFLHTELLIIIETSDNSLRNIINEILTINFSTPILTNPASISRIRSIVRKLNKPKQIKITEKKEFKEISNLIEELKAYDLPQINMQHGLKEIISGVVRFMDDLLNNRVESNEKGLERLSPFITLNQLLRYLTEIEEEDILLLEQAEIVDVENQNKYVVRVRVDTYNIVNYLDYFFRHIGYEINKGVVNSSCFFVPQKRERYMILGVNKKHVRNEVILPESYLGERKPFTVYDAIADLANLEPKKNVAENRLSYSVGRVTDMQRYYRDGSEDGIIYNHVNTNSEKLSLERFKYIDENKGKNFHSLSKELKDETYTNSERTQNTIYLKLNYDVPSPTVINVRKSMWQHPKKVRAISIREAARLQSFKDNYIFQGTKDKQYQQVGNAVPPLMARAVAESMLYALGDAPINRLIDDFE